MVLFIILKASPFSFYLIATDSSAKLPVYWNTLLYFDLVYKVYYLVDWWFYHFWHWSWWSSNLSIIHFTDQFSNQDLIYKSVCTLDCICFRYRSVSYTIQTFYLKDSHNKANHNWFFVHSQPLASENVSSKCRMKVIWLTVRKKITRVFFEKEF